MNCTHDIIINTCGQYECKRCAALFSPCAVKQWVKRFHSGHWQDELIRLRRVKQKARQTPRGLAIDRV